ncbi:2-hydroxyacid dehydrogenase [Mycolicibacterium chitae]|uniref:D-3-phosphoglycerate dehydrogenase SerA2 n=1 Tax=Mycolicibacterium chitae TaxID=1792 RepID=A0A448I6M2_MYCCI|nr:D-2-hydroxyacid dehydrogenase family protein [Mycolicibacterium chitae]MCV7108121.1 D-2-hydroxyacid dehydrogenase family protein [Mycolicibacterium chitae]BBZ04529.1 2-hydroxyacid dehydrogenase [Mycolicibacterium chitae]VEG48161.1 D-3-phosphoglycerate dehydrogenase SerA2 [Mycolicibacterium chitae]
MKVAILDDYQGVALQLADWSPVADRAEITVFTDHLADPDDVVARLAPFDVVFVMRERTPLPREVLERLPRLRMIASNGKVNAAIDMAAAQQQGIEVSGSGGTAAGTVEMTWALILSAARALPTENASLRSGGWQTGVGTELAGRTLGVLGLGRIGSRVARVGAAFGMDVIAWSQNLTPAAAEAAGARWVDRDTLLDTADVLSIHLRLSDRTRGLIGADALARMKPTALLINTSRGPIVDEAALVSALRADRLGGAGLDVFDTEPLPAQHPLRSLDNVVATPHIGYVTDRQYRRFFADAVAAISDWLDRNSGAAR